MALDPLQALRGAGRPTGPAHAGGDAASTLLVAGATGALGQEVMRRLAGRHRFARTLVLAREPIRDGLAGVEMQLVAEGPIDAWPRTPADVALVLFEPPRLFHDRERALWTPGPADLPALAAWLRRGGVHTLAVVQPHDQGRLPEALKRGLATMDEHAVAGAGFDRVILLRSARKPVAARLRHPLERLAAWMLSITRFMVPSREQPVRAARLAELLDAALRLAPPGVHVAAPEMVWEAAQGSLEAVAVQWLGSGTAADDAA